MLLKPFADYTDLIAIFGDSELEYYEAMSKNELSFQGITLPGVDLVVMEQVHSDGVEVITESTPFQRAGADLIPMFVPQADAVITNLQGIYLCARTADCVPIFVYDPIKKIVAAAHSGREGTRLNIIGKTLKKIKLFYNSNPSNLIVAVGPSISQKHFDVSDEHFYEFVRDTDTVQEHPHLDLNKTVIKQILDSGVKAEHIINYPLCTYENDEYYSYRKNKTTLRQISVIGMKNE